MDLLKAFHETVLITTIGQSIDMQMAHRGVQTFTRELYQKQIYCKTSHTLLHFPLVLSMHMAGIAHPKLVEQIQPLVHQIGDLYQINNDYNDCYGDEKVTGKIGTDIQDNKCSWLVLVCMERATEQQKQILIENYGQRDTQKVGRIKQLYHEIGMEDLYKEYEKKSIQSILAEIERLPTVNLRRFMHGLLQRLKYN